VLRSGAEVRGMAHITGGGVTGNLDRCLPKTVDALLYRASWKQPAVFGVIADAARIADAEMLRTFNMGIGFCVIVSAKSAASIAATLREAGETVFEIGEIVSGGGSVRYA
jgi:phosphoribosylformylglycinamidine cyclo-ligase